MRRTRLRVLTCSTTAGGAPSGARKESDPIIHHTFDAGEGVLIPGEILHHAAHGCRAFVILQPFGCLPNHVVGRGISKRLKELYPDVQILPLDYRSGCQLRKHREPASDADHECEGAGSGKERGNHVISSMDICDPI